MSVDITKSIASMTLEELQEEISHWRNLWGWVPENVKHLLVNLGKICRIAGRDYKPKVGLLGQCYFELEKLELLVEENVRDYTNNKLYFEEKTVQFRKSDIVLFEIIERHELLGDLVDEPMVTEHTTPEGDLPF